MRKIEKLGVGGGCHWCTEAVFQSIKGVQKVEQGYIASSGEYTAYSEAVIVHFNPEEIPLRKIIEIHLYTHQSTSAHYLRAKYRSAIYIFSEAQYRLANAILNDLQKYFAKELITLVLDFKSFKASRKEIQDYYNIDPDRPFCLRYIQPKLEFLSKKFPEHKN